MFQIKKNSIYYCSNQKKLPLSQNNTTHVTNQSKYTNNLNITATNGTTHSFNNMSTPSSQGTVTGGAGNGQSMSFLHSIQPVKNKNHHKTVLLMLEPLDYHQ